MMKIEWQFTRDYSRHKNKCCDYEGRRTASLGDMLFCFTTQHGLDCHWSDSLVCARTQGPLLNPRARGQDTDLNGARL